ncbi:uncharacterized protein [Euphorbia lathyris]|uniref:uncharacterized protein isoform X2 n=1 Tax=Euphorbia lathyris TaxID=212925 RepID=UPI00331389C2
MEEIVKEQQPAIVVTGKSKLRYPLRSATKVKEESPPVADLSNSSTSKKGRSVSSVSKSVSVLNLSSKEKSAKPPRRLSTPAKSALNVVAKSTGTITPISEARTMSKRSTSGQAKNETPLSDISRTSSRKKFNMLASSSYWLSQIKLSESVSKHSISIGFFKLALEAGCEPIQRMRDELKSYVGRYELSEIGESVRELLESYNITENQEQVQVSETCSQVPEVGARSSDDEVHSSSTADFRKLRPRSLNADSAKVSTVRESDKKVNLQKNTSTPKTQVRRSKNIVNSQDTAGGRKSQKKPQRPSKQEAHKEKEKVKMEKQGKSSATSSEEGEGSPIDNVDGSDENKENVDGPMEEVSLAEVS